MYAAFSRHVLARGDAGRESGYATLSLFWLIAYTRSNFEQVVSALIGKSSINCPNRSVRCHVYQPYIHQPKKRTRGIHKFLLKMIRQEFCMMCFDKDVTSHYLDCLDCQTSVIDIFALDTSQACDIAF